LPSRVARRQQLIYPMGIFRPFVQSYIKSIKIKREKTS
jgi:hypothetical protein